MSDGHGMPKDVNQTPEEVARDRIDDRLRAAGWRVQECQFRAITKLEASLKADRPRALVQMATGSEKTYTAITQVYRLLKHAWRNYSHRRRWVVAIDRPRCQ